MNETIALLILCSPLIWELFDDRKGDIHPNNDWLVRGSIMLAASSIVTFFVDRTFWQALMMSFGIFTLFFPYLYNIFNNKKPWYNYWSKTAIPDKWISWMQWPTIMFILLWIFGVCASIYFWKEMMIWNYPYGQ
jgi:hypothetical protein